MTLEDAIVYYSETAKECRRKARIESNDYMGMKDRAYEAEQLTDWLNELKVLRGRMDAHPEIIHCQDCKWWAFDEEGPYKSCNAAKHYYYTKNWEIGIQRKYPGGFYCADAETREEETEDEEEEDE